MDDKPKPLGKIGLVGRFKPLHLGGYRLLEAACQQADKVVIGIGSANKYNLRNPFTAEESEAMINASLKNRFSNYQTVQIPDFAQIPEYSDGQRWKEYIRENFGSLDYFVSGNDYVRDLLKDSYPLLYPGEIVPRENWIKLRATQVRYEMARFGDWKALVPPEVAFYLKDNGIVERFRDEFGLQTLAGLFEVDIISDENLTAEQLHAQEV